MCVDRYLFASCSILCLGMEQMSQLRFFFINFNFIVLYMYIVYALRCSVQCTLDDRNYPSELSRKCRFDFSLRLNASNLIVLDKFRANFFFWVTREFKECVWGCWQHKCCVCVFLCLNVFKGRCAVVVIGCTVPYDYVHLKSNFSFCCGDFLALRMRVLYYSFLDSVGGALSSLMYIYIAQYA